MFFIFVASGVVFGNGSIEKILLKYKSMDEVIKILIVETNNNKRDGLIDESEWDKIKSLAKVHLYVKDTGGNWVKVFENEKAYIGISGPGKTKEGDGKTPLGEFNFVKAFGIKEKPERTILPYTKITADFYACDLTSSKFYNQIIDKNVVKHECKGHGEHMIEFQPHYFYVLTIDFNKDNDPEKGSNIFVHCFGGKPYTAGCVAISEEKMKYLLETIDSFSKLCII